MAPPDHFWRETSPLFLYREDGQTDGETRFMWASAGSMQAAQTRLLMNLLSHSPFTAEDAEAQEA